MVFTEIRLRQIAIKQKPIKSYWQSLLEKMDRQMETDASAQRKHTASHSLYFRIIFISREFALLLNQVVDIKGHFSVDFRLEFRK